MKIEAELQPNLKPKGRVIHNRGYFSVDNLWSNENVNYFALRNFDRRNLSDRRSTLSAGARATPVTKYDNRKYGFKIGGLNG